MRRSLVHVKSEDKSHCRASLKLPDLLAGLLVIVIAASLGMGLSSHSHGANNSPTQQEATAAQPNFRRHEFDWLKADMRTILAALRYLAEPEPDTALSPAPDP
jgi:hypothetical protein